MQQMLEAVNTIHEERIVHSDLKPANFLLVRGSLKLIDFGIAKAIMSDTTNIQRDAQVQKKSCFCYFHLSNYQKEHLILKYFQTGPPMFSLGLSLCVFFYQFTFPCLNQGI